MLTDIEQAFSEHNEDKAMEYYDKGKKIKQKLEENKLDNNRNGQSSKNDDYQPYKNHINLAINRAINKKM